MPLIHRLFVLFCGTWLGALLGPEIVLSKAHFEHGPWICATFACLGLIIPRVRLCSWFVGLVLWVCLHSPGPFTANGDAVVIRANGCGFISDDVLVETNRHHVTYARARAVVGDHVLAQNQHSFLSLPTAVVTTPTDTQSFLCYLASQWRGYLMDHLSKWPSGRREWLQSFVLGADMKVDSVTVDALRRLGLLHIVVLSGGHLAILSLVALFAVRMLPLAFYATRALTMRTWPFVWKCTACFAGLVVVGFAVAVGLPQSVQRALLMFLCIQLNEFFGTKKPSFEILLKVWIVQCIIFPIHILSLSMFLSWSGSMILAAFMTSSFRKSSLTLLREKMTIQCIFACLSLLAFGNFGLVGIFANLILGPLFSLALPANLFLFTITPDHAVSRLIVESQMSLLGIVRELAAWQNAHPSTILYLSRDFKVSTWAGKVIAGLFVGFLMIRIYQRSKARQNEDL